MTEFWVVWNPNMRPRNQPLVAHGTKAAATKEAERLARLNQDETFFLLHSIGACKAVVPPVQWKDSTAL